MLADSLNRLKQATHNRESVGANPALPTTVVFDKKTRDDAIHKVTDQADSLASNFSKNAQRKILELLADQKAASGEWLVNQCKLADIQPHDDRAFGGVFQGLVNRLLIERVGECARSKGHGTRGGSIYGLTSGGQMWIEHWKTRKAQSEK